MLISIEKERDKASVTRFNKEEGDLPPLMLISFEKEGGKASVTRFNKKRLIIPIVANFN